MEIAIYAPMIYTAPCIMFWMLANGSWALGIESFLGPVKCHRADRRVPFGAQKLEMNMHASKTLCTGLYIV
jgi:hypothetical protein